LPDRLGGFKFRGKKRSMMLLEVESVRREQLCGALEAQEPVGLEGNRRQIHLTGSYFAAFLGK
jgi:hypothetical protein